MDTSQPKIQESRPKEGDVMISYDIRSLTNRVCIGPNFIFHSIQRKNQTIVTAVRIQLKSFTTSNSHSADALFSPRCAHRWMFELRREAVVELDCQQILLKDQGNLVI